VNALIVGNSYQPGEKMDRKLSSEGAKHNRFQNLAIASYIIGILIVISSVIIFWLEYRYAWTMTGKKLIPLFVYFILSLIIISGVVSGVIGLWSNEKKRAIQGIILSLTPVIFLLALIVYFQISNS
jgi:hypothetical protein